jgi:hypothetical protein
LTGKLTDMDCKGVQRTVCRYFCPMSGKTFSNVGFRGYCPTPIGYTGRK